jgi:general secretion pathway protein A
VVLCGQPELEEKLKLPELRQLRQRIVLWCHTYPLTLEQTEKYIDRRLRVVGASHNPIGLVTLQSIQRYSDGIPRLINLICEHALIAAFVDRKTAVSPEMVETVARELGLTEGHSKIGAEIAVNGQGPRQPAPINGKREQGIATEFRKGSN